MKPIPATCIIGLVALTGLTHAQTAPEAQPKSATVSELGPAVGGNVLSTGQVLSTYDFDLAGDDGQDLDGWSDTMGLSGSGSVIFSSGGNNDGGRGTGGGLNGTGNQDSSHPTLVMTSPPFRLEPDMSISFGLAGGIGNTGVQPADLASVPAASIADGFQGMALRRLSDDAYLLYDRRSGNGNGFEANGWNSAEIEPVRLANPNELFVLDFIDYDHDNWGFAMVDDVVVSTVSPAPGIVALVSPPTIIDGAINTGWGGPLESVLNDGFAYNPLDPTNPMPQLTLTGGAAGNGVHNNNTNTPMTLVFDLVTPLADGADNQIVVDLYGRAGWSVRDNDVDVAFLDASDNVLGEVLGLAIPAGRHLRLSSTTAGVPNGSTIAKIRFTGNDSEGDTTTSNSIALMEVRVANLQANYNPLAGSFVTVTEVNGNAADVNTPITLPSGALLTMQSGGIFTYDPNGAFDVTGDPATDTFNYTINYATGTPTSATVTVTITDADQVTYVDDDWASMTPGDPIADADAGTAGDQPATYGTDAFASIALASLRANANSTVVINSGPYAETVAVSEGRTYVITGADAAGAVTISSLVTIAGTTVDIQGASILTLEAGSLAGDVTGSGSLAKTTAGSLTLSGVSTYSGGTTIDGGVLSLAGTSDLGTGGLTVNSDSTLALGADVTLAGALNGAAPLEITGGTLILTGDASGFTGTIAVASGGLGIAPGITLGGSVSVEDGAGIGGEGTISGNLALGTVAGIGCILVIDPDTMGALSADTLTLNGVTTVQGTPAFATATAMVSYGTSLTNDSGAASLAEAFVPAGGGRYSILDNAQTIELTLATPEDITFTGASGFFEWFVGANEFGDQNWGSTDGFFLDLDNVTFDDSVNELFVDTVTVIGTPQPGSITFNNSTVAYTIAGTAIGGTGGLTKNGSGDVFLNNINGYSGSIVVNDGRLEINNQVRTVADFTVNAPGTLVTSATNILVPNHGTPLPDTMVITVDGGTWICDAQHDARIGNVVLTNGGTWTSDRGIAAWDCLLTDVLSGPASVTVSGTGAATMNGTGGIHLGGIQNFVVEDTTGDAAMDLDVSMILDDGGNFLGDPGGINKTGAGTMFLSGANSYTGRTTVAEGCLTVIDLLAVPTDLTLVSVGAGAGFGGIVGAANLTDADIDAIAANAQWDAGGTAQLVLDTNGKTVNVHSNFAAYASTFTILAKGGGTLNLSGDLTGVTVNSVGDTTVTTNPVAEDVIVGSIAIDGTTVTIGFSGGSADVYASPDLQNWTPLDTNVAPSTFIETGATATERFYLLLPTGSPAP